MSDFGNVDWSDRRSVLVYCDWLEEHGRMDEASLLRQEIAIPVIARALASPFSGTKSKFQWKAPVHWNDSPTSSQTVGSEQAARDWIDMRIKIAAAIRRNAT